MSIIVKYLKNYKKESILAPVFKMTEACLELIVPLIVTKIIDLGIGKSDKDYIVKMGLVLLALGAAGFASSVTAQYFAAKAAICSTEKMRNDLFAHINKFSFGNIDSSGTSSLITRITNDINQIQTGINMVLRLFLRSPFIVFGSMIMAFTIDIKSAVIFTVAIPLLFAVVFGIMFLTIPVFKKIQGSFDKITMLTRENLTGIRVIRAFNRQNKEIQDFNKESDILINLQLFAGKISALLNPLTYIILNGAVIAILWVSGNKVYSGALTRGAVVALINYMSQILVELVKLSNLIVTVNKSAACISRVTAVFEKEPEKIFSDEECELIKSSAAVEFNDVNFSYGSSKVPALENISFKAYPGTVTGIIGATGSGKSTLVNLIPGFYRCTGGEVKLFGQNTESFTKEQINRLVSVVPQKAVLFNGTVKDNILIGKHNASDSEVKNALKLAEAEDFVSEKSGGLNYVIEQEGKNLSGGQKQRLTIARAFVKKSPVLILDDSMSALDFVTESKLRKSLSENFKDAAVFIVSQRVATVKGADNIIVLDDGKICGSGKHSELIKSCHVYKEICLSQLSEKEFYADEQ